jgi:hypothetical protein
VALREAAVVLLGAVLMLGGIALTTGPGGRFCRAVTRALLAAAVAEVVLAAVAFAAHVADLVTGLLLAGSIAATYAVAKVQSRRLRHRLSVVRGQLRRHRERVARGPGTARR